MNLWSGCLYAFAACAVLPACNWDDSIWIPRSKTADALYQFRRNGRAGYIDRAGKIVIPAALPLRRTGGYEFHDGLMLTEVGMLDLASQTVVLTSLTVASEFSEGLAVAKKPDERLWGYVNRAGGFQIDARFATPPDRFADGMARVRIGDKFGYIDHAGKLAIPASFIASFDFSDGRAQVIAEGPCASMADGFCGADTTWSASGTQPAACKFRFIDKAGRFITPETFDQARRFAERLAPVKKNGKWGFINETGKLAIDYRFDDAFPFSDGFARVLMNGAFGYIDHNGTLVIPPWFPYAGDFSDGLAAVGNEEEGYWYIDKSGQQAVPGPFAAASPFFKALAHIQFMDESDGPSDTYGYIDRTGKLVFVYKEWEQDPPAAKTNSEPR